MKKHLILVGFICLAILQLANGCTTFFINKNGQLIFGRNYDWITDAGMVCTNLKGLFKTSATVPDGNTVNWTSKYGSTTFNQYGKEFPMGGMNETGLVVEIMWADGTQYPKADDRPALNVLQWVQYQLDNHATIEEVIQSDANIRISQNNPPLHYLIADALGNAATIEFYSGKMVVHKGTDLPFPVLTNSSYEESAKTAMDAAIPTGNTSFSFQDNSLQRFATACSMVQQFLQKDITKPVVDYAFDILDKVSQSDFTKWSIVYDLKNKKVHFKTARYPDVKSVAFRAFDFICTSVAKALDINQIFNGDLIGYFQPFSNSINRKIMERAIEESKTQVRISDEDREANIAYASSIHCKK